MPKRVSRTAVRGKAQRAICPECGRDTAAMWNADMTEQRMNSTYLLSNHNIAPGNRCRGWIVGKEALVLGPADPSPTEAASQLERGVDAPNQDHNEQEQER